MADEQTPGGSFADEVARGIGGGPAHVFGPQEDPDAFARAVGAGIEQEGTFDAIQRPLEFAKKFLNQPELSGPGAPPHIRAFVSFAGDTAEEKRAAFQKARPDGDLIQVPETGIFVFRNAPTEPWRLFDPDLTQTPGGFGSLETLSDVADFTSDASNVLLEAASVGVPPIRGLRALRPAQRAISQVGRLTAGGATGELVEEGAQALLGTQRQSAGDVAAQAAMEGGFSLIGATIGAGIGAATNALRGMALFPASTEARAAMAAGEAIGAEPLIATQVTRIGILKRLGQQAAAVLPQIPDYLRRQNKVTESVLSRLRNPRSRARFWEVSRREFDRQADNLRTVVDGYVRNAPTDREAGIAVAGAVNDWYRAAGAQVDQAYRLARQIEEPVFDGARMFDVADDIAFGVPARAAEQGAEEGAQQALGGAIEEGAEEAAENIVQLRRLDPEIAGVLRDIRAMNRDLAPIVREGREVPVLEQLRELRTRLRDITIPKPGEQTRLGEAQAIRLRSAIEDVLQNPVNDSTEFVTQYRRAQNLAAKRFEVREQVAVKDLMRSVGRGNLPQEPERVVDILTRPGNADKVIAALRAVPRGGFEPVRAAFKRRLVEKPTEIARTLDELGENHARLLIPSRAERRLFRDYGQAWESLGRTNLEKAAKQEVNFRTFFQGVFKSRDERGLRTLNEMVQSSGGRNSPFGKLVRTGIIDEIHRRATVLDKGIRRVNGKKLTQALGEANDRGLLRFLTFEEKRILINVERFQSFVDVAASDAGTELVAAQSAGALRRLEAGVMTQLAEFFTVGRFMTNPVGINLLAGRAGKQPKDMVLLKLAGSMVATMASDIEEQTKFPEAPTALPQDGRTQGVQ